MDNLHVTSQQTGSKTSSRSASPCSREHHFHPHHTKTLSHGSVDSSKSTDEGIAQMQRSKHRSPTTSLNRTTDLDDSNHESALDGSGNIDEVDVSDLHHSSSHLSNGNTDIKHEDEFEGLDPKRHAILEQLRTKITRVRDTIRTEQKLRDDNVDEYLKLAASADKQQVQRIKAVFEKKNQKSAQIISQLQKKLDAYQKRVHDLEKYGFAQSHRPPREVLRDMGQGLKNVGGNIRDGIGYVGTSVVSKPREFAHLIKNKFGSADNISQLSTWYIGPGAPEPTNNPNGGSDQGDKVRHGSATLPSTIHMMTSQDSMAQLHNPKFPSNDESSECSSVTSESIGRYGRPQENQKDPVIDMHKKFRKMQEQLDSFKEYIETVRLLQTEIQDLNSSLQEERFKTERLEEQINDLTELHQNEVENLKQAMADMEEKVQYQSDERLRDIHEILEHCQTKIQKMEHQALQQQQYVNLEVLDNSNARALVVKLINVLLTVLQVILLLVATGAGIIMPFLRTRLRILSTVVIVIGTAFILKQWPEVKDIGIHAIKRLKLTLDPFQ